VKIPCRPFIFRPPLDAPPDVTPGGTCPDAVGSPARVPTGRDATKTCYEPGQAFDFTLTLLGKAVDFLPYFILAFREVAREGIGLSRARCEFDRVEALLPVGFFGVRQEEMQREPVW